MSEFEIFEPKKSARASLPRWIALPLAFILWTVLLPLVHGVLPWAISLLTNRHGWTAGRPGIWNLPALILVATGTGCLIWILVLHFVRTPERVELELTPKYLLKGGPYAFTRNPMYLAILGLWLGWALFYGSVAVLIGCLLLRVLMHFVVSREERALEARFGEAYLQYKSSVPRWLGRTRR